MWKIRLSSFGSLVTALTLVELGLCSAAGAGPRKPGVAEINAAPKVNPGEKVATALLELGQQRFAANDNAAALEAFTKAQGASPRDPRAFYMRAAVYQKLGKNAEAEADLRAALRLDPKLYDVRAELGALLTDSGRAAEAEELLSAVVAERAEHFEAWYNLGVARDALARWPQAVEAYRRAARLKPQDADVRVNLATALRRSGKIDEALAVAREAVTLAPDDAQAHLNLGLLLAEHKQLDDAVGELTAATRLQPNMHKAWWRLGVVQLRRNQPAAAITALQQAQKIRPSAEVLTDLGVAQRKQNAIADAEGSFRAALKVDARYQPARVHLLYTLAATGRCKEVRPELGQIPNTPEFQESINRIRATCQWSDAKGAQK